MRIIVRQNYASALYGTASAGKPIDVPADEAKRLIDANYAVPVADVKKVIDDTQPEPAAETVGTGVYLDEEPEPPKKRGRGRPNKKQ